MRAGSPQTQPRLWYDSEASLALMKEYGHAKRLHGLGLEHGFEFLFIDRIDEAKTEHDGRAREPAHDCLAGQHRG